MENTAIPIEKLLAHRDWVRALARRIVRDEATADDLEQQAWMAAMGPSGPRRESAVRGWFSRVVRNLATERGRTEQRQANRLGDVTPAPDAVSTGSVVETAELHRRVVDAVMTLEEPARSTVLLRFFEGLPPREVARRMETTANTVHSNLRRAFDVLRRRLSDRDRGGLAWLAPLAAPAVKTSAAGASAAATKGVALAGSKLAAAAAIVLVVGGVTWFITSNDRREDSSIVVPDGSSFRHRRNIRGRGDADAPPYRNPKLRKHRDLLQEAAADLRPRTLLTSCSHGRDPPRRHHRFRSLTVHPMPSRPAMRSRCTSRFARSRPTRTKRSPSRPCSGTRTRVRFCCSCPSTWA